MNIHHTQAYQTWSISPAREDGVCGVGYSNGVVAATVRGIWTLEKYAKVQIGLGIFKLLGGRGGQNRIM